MLCTCPSFHLLSLHSYLSSLGGSVQRTTNECVGFTWSKGVSQSAVAPFPLIYSRDWKRKEFRSSHSADSKWWSAYDAPAINWVTPSLFSDDRVPTRWGEKSCALLLRQSKCNLSDTGVTKVRVRRSVWAAHFRRSTSSAVDKRGGERELGKSR